MTDESTDLTTTRTEIIKRTIFILFIIGLFFSPVIIPFTLDAYDSFFYSQSSNFDSSKWSQGPSKYRYSVLDHIIKNVLEKNLTKSQVKSILGEPDRITEENWFYESIRPGFRFIDFSGGGLKLEFENRILIKYSNNTWID